jgi:hypothetical protein
MTPDVLPMVIRPVVVLWTVVDLRSFWVRSIGVWRKCSAAISHPRFLRTWMTPARGRRGVW